MRRHALFVLCAAALAALSLSCEEDDTYEYFDYSYIDTVLAADTIVNGQQVRIAYYLPGGCNSFERFETRERGDTLEISVLLLFYSHGRPCAHPPGIDTREYPLVFSSEGPWWLSYRRGEAERIAREIFVE